MEHEIAFYQVGGGLNAAAPAARLTDAQFARATNVVIKDRLPTTRPGVRVIPLTGETSFFAVENAQGAMYYNPTAGQGATVYGKEGAMMLFAVGGRKFSAELNGRALLTTAEVTDITNGLVADKYAHLTYWSQWENYALAGDGLGNTFIWDGAGDAFHSDGFNNTQKEESQVPNGGTAMEFVHGRGSIVVNSRAILTSDGLNSQDLTSAADVLKFREQVYWATGQYFAPPTSMGTINALAVLPLQDTTHGHGELLAHCSNGIFSVDLNIWPRSKWSETPMVRTAYIGPGAAGPYAVALFSGDQVFRASDGLKTLRSAKAEASATGSPSVEVSEPVATFFEADSQRWLRFASVASWDLQHRCLVTCYPIVQGRFRWHRGLVALNLHPISDAPPSLAWESLWTLPPQCSGIIQQINGKWDGEERHFTICRGDDAKNRLVEFRGDLKADVLEDGTEQRIRCQLVTRKIDANRPFTRKNFGTGMLYLANIEGRVDFGVWFRTYGSTEWKFWQSGHVTNIAPASEALTTDEPPREATIPLGNLPDKCGSRSGRYIQFLIRWAGYCSVESLRIAFDDNDPKGDAFNCKDLKVTFVERADVSYSDYEYNAPESESWLNT